LHVLERALDRDAAHLSVALARVAIPRREVRAVDGHRQVEGRAGDELLAVEVAAPAARRDRGVDPRLRRRHPEDAEERAQLDLAARRVAAGARVGVERPDECRLAGGRRAPGADPDLVDPHLERLTGPGAADLDRAEQRVPGVELRVAGLVDAAR